MRCCKYVFQQTVSVGLIQFGRRRAVRSTGVLFIYWLLQLISASLILQSRARAVQAQVRVVCLLSNCDCYTLLIADAMESKLNSSVNCLSISWQPLMTAAQPLSVVLECALELHMSQRVENLWRNGKNMTWNRKWNPTSKGAYCDMRRAKAIDYRRVLCSQPKVGVALWIS